MHLIGNDEEIIMLINTNKVALKYHRSQTYSLKCDLQFYLYGKFNEKIILLLFTFSCRWIVILSMVFGLTSYISVFCFGTHTQS